eukprot:GILK01000520.1.p1 GENE.GILK01000520.1~~GILK01000520.1.p1  ORF type:complete len:571 (+),score=88.07 GILK01000520.1:155-1714(+)
MHDTYVTLERNSNQALGIGQFAVDFINEKIGTQVDAAVFDRVELFHTDSVMCGLSALALGTNAPTILRNEALQYTVRPTMKGATVFGDRIPVAPEKAIVANCAAVREWDSNGTVFGYNAKFPGHQAGEFGHNDFYPIVIAAAQVRGILSGETCARGMILLDEIRGRLAEVFSLKTYKIDHVVHGAIASAATYGALLGASPEQIEHAIGMVVAHYIPWRAIRAGKQLSDSKGASAALSTEVAILSMIRAMNGFIGPKDIFRNPEALFRQFEPTSDGSSPFDVVLSHSGSDFAVMGMHFKLGLYEHQSAGALEGLIQLLTKNPEIVQSPDKIEKIKITAYEPAFGIIGDPAKRDPKTRQSADHSMVYIVSTMLRKAIQKNAVGSNADETWKQLMLMPTDYSPAAIANKTTRALMDKITFEHGGPEYDKRYPDGIPTSIEITCNGKTYDSGLVMHPTGHARNTTADLTSILNHKFQRLGRIAVRDVNTSLSRLSNLRRRNATDVQQIYDHTIHWGQVPIDHV